MFDSIESLTTTFATSAEPTLETTTVTEVALGYHRNQQYSITAMTTSTGAVAERYAYTAYGQPTILNASGTVLTSSAVGNRYSYTGREWDETLGLHHFRARWMSPLAGRFLTRDPIGFEGSPFDLYESLESSPLEHTDPLGLNPLAVARVIFTVLSIGSSAHRIAYNLSADGSNATRPSPFSNNYKVPNSFSFEGEPGGKSTNNRDCPCTTRPIEFRVFHEKYRTRFGYFFGTYDEYWIKVWFSYCHGKLSGHTKAGGSNSQYLVAWVTESVNAHESTIDYECECMKTLPCANVTFGIRRFVDQPWYTWPVLSDSEQGLTANFTVCADGTFSRSVE
jgi:RHS repeat-associated protein